jgi:hypothetical protein
MHEIRGLVHSERHRAAGKSPDLADPKTVKEALADHGWVKVPSY